MGQHRYSGGFRIHLLGILSDLHGEEMLELDECYMILSRDRPYTLLHVGVHRQCAWRWLSIAYAI